MGTALHGCLAFDMHMFTARFVCGPKCPALFVIGYLNYSFEQGKSGVIVEVKDVKPSTKKKKKLKTNSHTRKNREKKMMLNFRIRNLAISRRNG